MVVHWMPDAREHLTDIFNYYRKVANSRTAVSIRKEIIQTAKKLGNFPRIGIKEESIIDEKSATTYYSILVNKNYRLVYRIEKKGVFIDAVWDVRQNPAGLAKVIIK